MSFYNQTKKFAAPNCVAPTTSQPRQNILGIHLTTLPFSG